MLSPSLKDIPGEKCGVPVEGAGKLSPLLSEDVESSAELEHESRDYKGKGEQMDDILPTTECVSMKADPVDFTVSMDCEVCCVVISYPPGAKT